MIIQRFVSLNRFLSSFEKKDEQWKYRIRFNSPALYDDPWEGLGNGFVKVLKAVEPTTGYFNRVLQDGGIIEESSRQHTIKAIYRLQGNQDQLLLDELENAIEYSNQHLCSCWFIGDEKNEVRESWAMWNQYASMNGVLLAFDLSEVKRSIRHPIKTKKVRYTNFINAKFNKCIHQEISSLFYKDLAYKHEQEYRIIITKLKTSLKTLAVIN